MAGALVALLGATASGGGGGMGGLTVTASPLGAVGTGNSAADIAVTTNEVTASCSDGTAPYSYAWADLGGTGTWAILSPTSATTRFRCDDVPGGGFETRNFECTVTDSRGRTGTAMVIAEAYNLGGL
jgi:hypothetical protein